MNAPDPSSILFADSIENDQQYGEDHLIFQHDGASPYYDLIFR